MKRVLYCASTASHINNFHIPYLEALHNMGFEVHVAVNENVPIKFADKVFALSFYKNLLSFRNIKAIFQAKKLLDNNNYEKVITNTTLAGVIVRAAALLMKNRPKICHIVHGYIFNADSGIKKYFYLIPEKITAKVSDVVMVMNQEDYEMAKKYKLYKDKLYYIDGMGVDPSRFKLVSPEEKIEYKKKLGFSDKDFLFVYVAEFSKRKNQKMLIKAFSKCNLENAHLLLAGDGKMLEQCKRLSKKLNQEGRIHFLGYVDDVPSLYCACDCAVSTSKAEGLPFNIIEAMGCGLPVVASDVKGHRELIENKVNGFLYSAGDEIKLIEDIENQYRLDNIMREWHIENNVIKSKEFTLSAVFEKIMLILG
jgi:glycosyltransferase EpsD